MNNNDIATENFYYKNYQNLTINELKLIAQDLNIDKTITSKAVKAEIIRLISELIGNFNQSSNYERYYFREQKNAMGYVLAQGVGTQGLSLPHGPSYFRFFGGTFFTIDADFYAD